MKQKLKIINIPRRFVQSEWGGTETVILNTSKKLNHSGHDSQIICPKMLTNIDHEWVDNVEVTRVPYIYPYLGLSAQAKQKLDKKAGNAFSFSLAGILLNTRNMDIIHLHTNKRIGAIARTIARYRKIPYVVSLHGGILDVPDSEISSWTEPTKNTLEWGKFLGALFGSRCVLEDAAAIICVGQSEYEKMCQVYPDKKVIYQPNGVDYERYQTGNDGRFRETFGINSDSKIILNVGRIDPQKNQLALIESMPEILHDTPGTKLVLIGPVTSHAYKDVLNNAINKLKLKDNVILIDGLPPNEPLLIDAYAAADVFALPSIHEPFGIVVLEAWAAGLPVVAHNIGGIKNLIDHNETGLTYDNHQTGLPNNINKLLHNEILCASLRKKATLEVKNKYDWNIITENLIHLYQDVINEHTLH